LTTHIWSATSPGNASVSGNWTPAGPPGVGDIAHFNAGNPHACTWDIAAVDEIHHQGQTVLIFAGTNVALKGLRMDTNAQISVTSATQLNFSGTAPYLSNKSYILIGATSSPFVNASSRSNLTFSIAATGTISFDCGEYPKVSLASGTFTPQFITPSVTNATDVKMLSLSIASGVTFEPTGTPATTDRTKNWIIEGDQQSQFACSAAAFDGGFATWTFQAIAAGFLLPVSGHTAAYTGTFKFHKMVIGNLNGVGSWATIGPATRLVLNDLTVEAGVSLKADDNIGSAILLVNRPTINGTWGFIPLADGYYVYPKKDILGFRDGGTGLNTLGSANQVLATNAGATAIEWQTVSGGGGTVDVVSNVATSKILGRITAGSGDSEELSQAQVLTFLGNVEAGATTDQSNAEIRAAVEAATDSNVFTDADHSKLNAIEASATADQTAAEIRTLVGTGNNGVVPSAGTNGHFLKHDGTFGLPSYTTNTNTTTTSDVEAAGALMDSEVTNLAQVKAFDESDYATAAQGGKADSAQQPPSEGPFVNGDKTKLDNNTTSITAITTKSKMSVCLSSNASYTSGATIIPHNLVMWDTGSNFDPSTNSFIAPRDGHYLVTCSYYSTVAPSWSFSLIYVDDGTGFAIRLRRESSNSRDNMISGIIQLGAGHKVAHYAYRSSSSGDIGAALNTLTYFQVTEMV
jgi:hypothetical protein